MEIRRIDVGNFACDALDSFSRYQVVEQVYRLAEGKLQLARNPFTEDWSAWRKREKADEIRSGRYIAYGAWEGSRVVGVLMLVPQLASGRMIIKSFHVSDDMRRRGIGRALLAEARRKAGRRGASALYISACSAQETVDFYRAMGFALSANPIQAYAQDEPCDIQMECAL